MLHPERIPLSEGESATLEKLIADHEGESVSLTRRDPGETGPLLVHIGAKTWEVQDDGKRKKVS